MILIMQPVDVHFSEKYYGENISLFEKYQDTCGQDLNPLSRVMSVKFLLVISLLYKTEWS